MATVPDRAGSLSADAYKDLTLITNGPYAHTAPAADRAHINTNQPGLTYDVDGTVKSGFVHTAPAPAAPSHWVNHRDPYASGGVEGLQ